MIPQIPRLSFAILLAAGASALDLGNTVFLGDSITQGGQGYASYRMEVWKYLVDDGVNFNFVGSQTGAYANNAGTIPTYQGQTFSNVHDGHWGWRASWESGAVPLLDGRYGTNNLGTGVLTNWLGLASTYRTAGTDGVTNLTTRTYTGSTYTPNTAFILLGTNDIASSGGTNRTAAQVYADIGAMVSQLQTANANVRVYLLSVPDSANMNATQLATVATLNANLSANAGAAWSTGTSTVSYADIRTGFVPTTAGTSSTQTDGTHPNAQGQKVIANHIASALGIGPRTVGLTRRDGVALATQQVSALPGTTAGAPLYRSGSGWSTGGDGKMNLNASGSASTLRSDWALTAGANYTVEVDLQMLTGATNNNFVIWADDGAGGAVAGFLRIYADKTAWGYTGTNTYTSVLDFNANTGVFHNFRMVYDGSAYQVWRDGLLIGESLAGSAGASVTNNLTLGNYAGAETTNAIVNRVSLDTSGAYAPVSITAVPEPAEYGLFGAAGITVATLIRRRRRAHAAA